MSTSVTKIGIWMDYSIAHLMEYSNSPFEVETIESNFTQKEKVNYLLKGEEFLQNKEKEKQSNYYKKLMAIVKKYQEVILFGPTNAKEELFNALAADSSFWHIKVRVTQTDKMSAQQQHEFIREFFANN